MSRPRPPRAALAILARLVRPGERDAVLGDVVERFHERAAHRGPAAARRGVWGEVARFSVIVPREWLHRLRDPDPGPGARPPGFGRLVGGLWQDLRSATRSARRDPLFSALVIAILTIGIGANTAVFSIANGLLLRPLPYDDPEALLQLSETSPDIGTMDLSYPDFARWRERTEVFSGMAAFDDSRFILRRDGRTDRIEGAVVSSSLFDVLGVRPVLGRSFLAEEEGPGADPVVLLSHGFWQQSLGGSAEVVGSTLDLSGRPRTVVGVMPPRFNFPEVAELWVPIGLDVATADPDDYDLDAIGRLTTDATIELAQSEADAVAAELARGFPETKSSIGAVVYPLRAADVGEDVRLGTWLLLLAVGAVLLVACTNLVNLVAARGVDRRREMVLRRALGAGTGRVARLVAAEVGLLVLVAGAAGLALGDRLARALELILPAERPFWVSFALDGRVVAFAIGVTAVVLLAVAVGPALDVARSSAARLSGSRATATRRERRLTSGLLAAQVAVSFALLAAASATIRSLVRLQAVDAGFEPRGVVAASVIATGTRPESGIPLFEEVVDEVRSVPAVGYAAATDSPPLIGGENETAFEVPDRPVDPGGPPRVARVSAVTPGYFATLGIGRVAGRDFETRDADEAPRVAIVNERLASTVWGDESPLGKRVRVGESGARSPVVGADRPWATVVGVVRDVRHGRLSDPPRPAIYVPFAQAPSSSMIVLARVDPSSTLPPATLVERIRGVDVDLIVEGAASFETIHARSIWAGTAVARLMALLAAVAVGLALLGIYGVTAVTTRRRIREFGVRLALGATKSTLVRLALARLAFVVTAGLAVGLATALVLNRVVGSLLYGVGGADPLTLGAVGLGLAAAALAAAYLPARRAGRADPVRVLDAE